MTFFFKIFICFGYLIVPENMCVWVAQILWRSNSRLIALWTNVKIKEMMLIRYSDWVAKIVWIGAAMTILLPISFIVISLHLWDGINSNYAYNSILTEICSFLIAFCVHRPKDGPSAPRFTWFPWYLYIRGNKYFLT